MTMKLSRRAFGGLSRAAPLASTLASVGALAAAGGTIRLIWWGNPERDKRTNAVVDLFTKADRHQGGARDLCLGRLLAEAGHPGGRHEPARRDPDGLPLHLRMGPPQPAGSAGRLHRQRIWIWPISTRTSSNSGKVDGKLYGISLGANSMSHVYNKDGARRAGRDPARPDQMDHRRLGGAWARTLKGKLPDGHVFHREHGPAGTAAADLGAVGRQGALHRRRQARLRRGAIWSAFFHYWKMMQDEGLTPPADVQAQDSGKMEESMMATGHAVVQLPAFEPAGGDAEA